jgi:hypothetical protein
MEVPKIKTDRKTRIESTAQEIAAVLRSTDKMAVGFAQRVQERVGQPVPYTDILAVMRKMPSTSLSMAKVVIRLKRQLG